ncbi:BolA protein [Cordyceps fumosorosea ARSEF 2679]|uniref:BolA protein n=1 Tax=Cordyceps fumosorosea (strain ARSEF 2679) TaxID=1081104 RepID=A0A167LLJ3_CORFA|nr:BolA protein [Cordyceps fumosorosea ARSEF 2679]OAA53224.1 BolA protein [Cordyceps fumosorosea ARSEF 2679]
MQPSLLCTACRRAARARARAPLRLLARPITTARPHHLSSSPVLRSSPPPPRLLRLYSSSTPAAAEAETPSMTDAEAAIARLLVDALSPSALLVQDVSGGCGSMYAIDIAAEAFRGQSVLRQQRMVNAALGELVRTWHGVQIRTSVPEKPQQS